nr:MAG: nucleocapsid [Hainan phenui-like virus 7]
MSSAEEIYAIISSTDASDIDEFVTLFAYDGFNPEKVHAHFADVLKRKSISSTTFINDMRALITLGALKGNYTRRNQGKMTDEGREAADELFSKYEMKMGALGEDRSAIILPRVLAAFPELTTKVIMKAPPRNFGHLTQGLPRIMKNPVFPALVPHSLDNSVARTFLWLYTVYSAEQSLQISQLTVLEEAFTAQKQFVTIAFNSTCPKENTRIAMFKSAVDRLVKALEVSADITVGEVPTDRASPDKARKAIEAMKLTGK